MLHPRSRSLLIFSATALLTENLPGKIRIRRQYPLTEKINSSPIAGTARFSSVI
jgi:hypothetical protein